MLSCAEEPPQTMLSTKLTEVPSGPDQGQIQITHPRVIHVDVTFTSVTIAPAGAPTVAIDIAYKSTLEPAPVSARSTSWQAQIPTL